MGAEGIVLSSGSITKSLPDGTVVGKPGYSIGRLSETDATPRSILELTKRSARFFRHPQLLPPRVQLNATSRVSSQPPLK